MNVAQLIRTIIADIIARTAWPIHAVFPELMFQFWHFKDGDLMDNEKVLREQTYHIVKELKEQMDKVKLDEK